MKRSQIELWARLFLTCSLGHCYRGLVDIYYMIIVVNNLVFIYFRNNKRALGHDEAEQIDIKIHRCALLNFCFDMSFVNLDTERKLLDRVIDGRAESVSDTQNKYRVSMAR